MGKMNYKKYVPYEKVNIPDRTWPEKRIEKAPVWCSVDLRDGNQALYKPMSVSEKLELFKALVEIGFKEIEIGFPAASETEFAFLRKLIEEKHVPSDVTIQVLTQAREHLIKRSFEALAGAENAIVHVYNSTSTVQREVVFGKNKKEIIDIAVNGVNIIKECAKNADIGKVRLQYSPESFTGTELDYALEISEAVIDAWQPTPDNKIILNLPATVEMSSPNLFADRIEWFSRNVKNRENVIISVHTHNDRGTAVAAAELSLMAGADRVEGALFGNGERCGNMDLVTIALNIFTQGVDPELDFSDIDKVKEVYTRCTRMPVHERHPYAGDLVYTAFSGSHQDAIRKGMKAHQGKEESVWDVPYLPIDPQDVGRDYEAIIRINSQSGKGGVAYIMETDFGVQLPKWMQVDFSKSVQKEADRTGKELSGQEIYDIFTKEYIDIKQPFSLKKCHIDSEEGDDASNRTKVNFVIEKNGESITVASEGNGPVDAFVRGFRDEFEVEFSLVEYSEHALEHSSEAQAIAYVKLSAGNGSEVCGAGFGSNISVASMRAVISAVNRIIKHQ